MRILYGVQTTGNGHITRSSKIIYKLIKRGCQVDILFSGSNSSSVKFPFPVKYHLSGFTFLNNGVGEVDYFKTYQNLKFIRFLKDIKLDLSNYDLIISDFEPITAWAARLKERRCIGISNQSSFVSKKTPRPEKKSFIGEGILKWMAPVSDPIGIHFDSYDSFIKTPILKESMFYRSTSNQGHYTVYLPNYKLELIVSELNKFDKFKFEVFDGLGRGYRSKNCMVRPINKETFDGSLRCSQGVITAGGFQTVTESLYLGKKLLVIPTKGQYESECNAFALSRMGVMVGGLSDIASFMENNNIIKVNWTDSSDDIVNIVLNFRFK